MEETTLTRDEVKIRYEIFDKHALKDQMNYYEDTVKRNDTALRQVNIVRATIALLTGVASAAAALITQLFFAAGGRLWHKSFGEPIFACGGLRSLVLACIVLSIVLPAVGGFFNSLMDLFQWDRLTAIYESASENIRKADALSPDNEQDDGGYRQSFLDYVHGTLQVMSDETAQWGQSIRSPKSTEEFLASERKKAGDVGGDADAGRSTTNKPEGDAG